MAGCDHDPTSRLLMHDVVANSRGRGISPGQVGGNAIGSHYPGHFSGKPVREEAGIKANDHFYVRFSMVKVKEMISQGLADQAKIFKGIRKEP